jgi:drug/metabolite transporter (DMT)-like permease
MINKNSFGIFLGIASTFAYAIMDSSIKFASFNYEIDFVTFYFHSSTIIAMFLFLIGFSKLKMDLFKTKQPFIILLRGLITFANFYLVFYILKVLPLDIYYSVVFTAPLIASVLAVFFLKEKFSLFKAISLILGFFGILVITNPFSESFNQAYIFPIMVAILISFLIASSGLITRKYLVHENSIRISFYVFVICTIFSGIASFTRVGMEAFVVHTDTFKFVLLTAITCLVGFSLFLKAYQITPLQLVAPTEYALIIWGVLFGYIIFNNATTINTIIGCLIVIASNVIIAVDSKKE